MAKLEVNEQMVQFFKERDEEFATLPEGMKEELGYRTDFTYQNKIVQQDELVLDGKRHLISTVDLGIDHSFGFSTPLWYETMIFQEGKSVYMRRYETREEAYEYHQQVIEWLEKGIYTEEDGDIYFLMEED